MADRLTDIIRFYSILSRLEQKIGGRRKLSFCKARMNWPLRGVYFFMEEGELRTDTGEGLRIVRVGTHALQPASKTSLWNRLTQHKGQEKSGGGNHRGSIFKLIVGSAFLQECEEPVVTWGQGSTAKGEIRKREEPIERQVSKIIREMPFLWLAINDDPGRDSLRGSIERNAIALLSNYKKPPLDPPSSGWLGHRCDREKVRCSGMWNQDHVDKEYDPAFLDILERLVQMNARAL
jgi:hypothetical protein